jgi:NAD(P)H-dependent FMN reductase
LAKIGVITSTNREGRVGPNIARWFLEEVAKANTKLEFTLLDVDDLPFLDEPQLPATGEYKHEATKKWSETIKNFDGFVIINAEYNHGFTGVIKNALDSLYHEWNRKVVGFVGYGSYGAESSIMALRAIISYLNMMPIRESVRITKAHEALDESGRPKPDYILGNMEKFVAELEWWVKALNAAKQSDQT